MRKSLNILLFLCYTVTSIIAQQAMVVGNVRSKTDKSPIPAVNIYFKDSNIGTTSDEDGFYVIKNSDIESVLVFSCVGYKTQEHKIKPNELVGLYVELKEDNNWLEDLFVLPGSNPALDLMEKVRGAKDKNDISQYSIDFRHENQEVLMLKRNRYSENATKSYKKIADLAFSYDSMLFIPLYLNREQSLQKKGEGAQIVKKETKSSPENAYMLYEKVLGDLPDVVNIYQNSILLFGKHFISPVASAGNVYYRYYLMDSVVVDDAKHYQIRFKSKNNKNLAFNGDLWVDSASYAITKVKAELPLQSNINYIRNLKINIDYDALQENLWIPAKTAISLNMDYQLLTDSDPRPTEVLLEKKLLSKIEEQPADLDTIFALNRYTQEELEHKMAEMNETPMMKTAKWIADGVLTGYVKAGFIDIGKVYQLARITDVEGFRFSLPLRTNEMLSEHFELGGYWGYGFANNKHNYSVYAGYKLPIERKTVISGGYTDDYRRIDYDYNGFLLRENPLLSGDEDIANTIFAFRSSRRINHRKEWYAAISHDWNDDIESKLYFRHHNYTGNDALPFKKNGVDITSMQHQSISFTTRFSKNERSYEDHLNRIYIGNLKPVLYLTFESGNAIIEQQNNYYGKVQASLNQTVLFRLGEWNYAVDAGWLVGKAPYNLLWVPQGGETRMFKRYQYNLMNYTEYAFDKYVGMHNELVFNGIVLNQIPLVRLLNLREMLTFKCVYGDLSSKHAELLDFPDKVKTLSYPYMEVGVGVTNILRLFSLQSVWRLNDFGQPGVRPWTIIGGIRLSF